MTSKSSTRPRSVAASASVVAALTAVAWSTADLAADASAPALAGATHSTVPSDPAIIDPQLVIDAILDAIEAADVTIVGSWHRAQSCEEMLAVFDAAGLAESHLGWLQGNFFAGDPGPTEGDVCEGALGPLEHDHFFTDAGEFGSHDEHGEEVDGGDYEQVDDDTLAFPSHATEFGFDGDLTVDYEITGDVVTFEVVLPDECDATCNDAYAWALSAFASGPWTSGEVPT